jgi:drug/metabolite transporter (DMT)-like permease
MLMPGSATRATSAAGAAPLRPVDCSDATRTVSATASAQGVADFSGGKASRERSALVVVLASQAVGLLAALAAALAAGSFSDPTGYVPWAVGAGLAGALAVVLFYRALAIGTMGVVAPLAALGVVVPVMIGLLGGALPSLLCLAGIVVAVAGVTVAARPGHTRAPRPDGHARSIVLALGAALGFGFLQYAISGGSAYSTVMTMVAMRASSVPVLALVTLFTVRSARRDRLVQGRTSWRLRSAIVAVGVFDVSANLLFGLATLSGELAVVAVLGSLYPAVTVLLARVVDDERLSRVQNVGVAAAVAGVAMIAAGS